MTDVEERTAGGTGGKGGKGGKVLWHFTMSLDGFVAGPAHDMGWMSGCSLPPGLVDRYVRTTGAVLCGRGAFDSAIGDARPYGGAWQGPVFVLTHHPEDARPAEGITVLSCPVEQAVDIALAAAGGKNVEVFSPSIGRQLLERGRIDEIDLHLAPVLLGDGIRLYDNPGAAPVRLRQADGDDPGAVVTVRYRPAAAPAEPSPAGGPTANVDVARALLQAYLDQDRARAESLLADGLTFTSPQDDHIDRDAYFERCFPTADRLRWQRLLHAAALDAEHVVIAYEYQLKTGERHRNTEILTVHDGRVGEIQVFFGGPVR